MPTSASATAPHNAGIHPATWNPLDTLPNQPGALAERVKGNESRFASAMGAALAVLEMES